MQQAIKLHKEGKLHDAESFYKDILKTDSENLVVCIDEKNDLEENKKSIDVVTGSLCLFPSSLHHYTIPFESNEERIVLAFDVIPK